MTDYFAQVTTDQIYTAEVTDNEIQVVEVITSGLQGPAGAAGQGVPTGGTSGQVLTKQSATNYDATWVDPAGGGAIVDTGSWGSPTLITTSITAPSDQRARMFLAGNGGAVVDPPISSGSGTKELFLLGTSNSATIELNSTTNLLLSGKMILRQGSMLELQWVPGLNKYVEVGRNEI